jgi:hypothetical protein
MRNALSKFIRFLLRSRLAQLLFLIHLVLALYAISMTPHAPADFSDLGGGCHGLPLAGRWIHLCDATGLMKFLGTVDIVALFLYVTITMLYTLLALLVLQITGWDAPQINLFVFSWLVAVGFLIYTSFQWMLVGACIESVARFFAKRWYRQHA